MPIIKSAKKRVRVAARAAVRNSKTKRSLKSSIKAFQAAVTGGDKKKLATTHSKVQSGLDQAGKKGVMHKNKIARKKRQLAAQAKAAAGVSKTSTVKSSTEKPVRQTESKPAAKKAAAKKAPAKKPATKKTSAKK